MHVLRTPRFDEEAARFALRFTCDDCRFFDEPNGRCLHGWPTAQHRRSRYERAIEAGAEVVFCKEFEVR